MDNIISIMTVAEIEKLSEREKTKRSETCYVCHVFVQLPLAVRQNQAKISGDTMILQISKVHQWPTRAGREEI